MESRVNIRGERVTLRGVELGDIDLMYGVENDLLNWGVSGTTQPFSKYLLEQFIEIQRLDIYTSKQLRLMVESCDGAVVGIVDLFDFDPQNHRAGVGIITFEGCRGKGYGGEMLRCIERYAREVLQLHQLWCGVAEDNEASLRLFERCGYERVGLKRDWLWRRGGYVGEVTLQRML